MASYFLIPVTVLIILLTIGFGPTTAVPLAKRNDSALSKEMNQKTTVTAVTPYPQRPARDRRWVWEALLTAAEVVSVVEAGGKIREWFLYGLDLVSRTAERTGYVVIPSVGAFPVGKSRERRSPDNDANGESVVLLKGLPEICPLCNGTSQYPLQNGSTPTCTEDLCQSALGYFPNTGETARDIRFNSLETDHAFEVYLQPVCVCGLLEAMEEQFCQLASFPDPEETKLILCERHRRPNSSFVQPTVPAFSNPTEPDTMKTTERQRQLAWSAIAKAALFFEGVSSRVSEATTLVQVPSPQSEKQAKRIMGFKFPAESRPLECIDKYCETVFGEADGLFLGTNASRSGWTGGPFEMPMCFCKLGAAHEKLCEVDIVILKLELKEHDQVVCNQFRCGDGEIFIGDCMTADLAPAS